MIFYIFLLFIKHSVYYSITFFNIFQKIAGKNFVCFTDFLGLFVAVCLFFARKKSLEGSLQVYKKFLALYLFIIYFMSGLHPSTFMIILYFIAQ